jgi:dihydrofolate reductase
MITLVAAIGPRGEIGYQGGLPWSLPGDLARFRRETMGKAIIMGRRTFESIGKPLDGRLNIVVTSREMSIPSLIVTVSLRRAIDLVGRADCCVIGGERIYAEALPHCSYAALTLAREPVNADTFFPVAKFNSLGWDILARWPEQGWDGVLVRRSNHPVMPFKLETR